MPFSRLKTITAAAVSCAALAIVFACNKSTAKAKPQYVYKPGQGAAGIVASIDGKPLTLDEALGENKLPYIEALGKAHGILLDGVGTQLLAAEYGEAAAKAKLGLDEYLETKVLSAKVTDAEITKFAQERNVPKAQLNDAVKKRISDILKSQKAFQERGNLVAKLTQKHKTEVYVAKPEDRVKAEVGNSPTTDAKNAKVTVMVFSDFQCPYCARAAQTVKKIKDTYKDRVLLVFKHFPLPMHPNARPASEASMCVYEQGKDLFWEYHDLLFANYDKLEAAKIKELAGQVKDKKGNKVKMDQFTQCVDAKKYAAQVQENQEEGRKLGISSTPTFLINGKLLPGAQPFEAFQEIIEDELADAK